MRKVLITGANGFIGCHCLSSLSTKGYEIHTASRKTLDYELPNLHWHQVDLLDAERVSALINQVRPTHLLHLAWFTVPGEYWASLENLRWIRASIDLLETFAKSGGERAVVAGSCAEYDWRYGYCSEEITPLMPTTLYGASKHALRCILDAFARETGINAAWGRIFFLYGPHEHPARLVSSVIRSLLKGEVAQCSHGNQIRDFLYVDDVAEALVALLESDVTGPVNIGSGLPVTIREIVTRIGEKIGRTDLLEFGTLPSPANDPPLLIANVTRLTEEVGWNPRIDLDVGLEQTIEWWKTQIQV